MVVQIKPSPLHEVSDVTLLTNLSALSPFTHEPLSDTDYTARLKDIYLSPAKDAGALNLYTFRTEVQNLSLALIERSLIPLSRLLSHAAWPITVSSVSDDLQRNVEPLINSMKSVLQEGVTRGAATRFLLAYEAINSALGMKGKEKVLLPFMELTQQIYELAKAIKQPEQELRMISIKCKNVQRLLVSLSEVAKEIIEPPKNLSKDIRKLIGFIGRVSEYYGDLLALTQLPQQTAEGLTRTRLYYSSPEVLSPLLQSRGWGMPPVADVVIIGGGPAGITAALYAHHFGLKGVVFEGECVAQAFSDARAQAVHRMRTTSKQSSLIRPGVAPEVLNRMFGMPQVIERQGLEELSSLALQEVEEITGHRARGVETVDSNDSSVGEQPVKRGELFGYLTHIPAQIHAKKDVFFVEQSPVTSVVQDRDNLLKVQTAQGHELLTRKLVLASGFVGMRGDFVRTVPALSKLASEHPTKYLVLQDERDLARRHEFGELILYNDRSRQPIISDVLLGRPEVQHYLARLSAGTVVAVIGSGESAAKAVLEILSNNPHVYVHLYTKSPLEPSQLQHPSLAADLSVLGILDRHVGKRTVNLWRSVFGTPITPETMLEILGEVRKGSIKVMELGAPFSDKDLLIRPNNYNGQISTEVVIKDKSPVNDNLLRQSKEWTKLGLLSEPLVSVDTDEPLDTITGPIIVAAGYDRKELRVKDKLTQQLIEEDLIEIVKDGREGIRGEIKLDPHNGLSSAADSRVVVLGAGNFGTATDGSIPGIGTRASLAMRMIDVDLYEPERAQDLVKTIREDERERLREVERIDVSMSRFPEREKNMLSDDEAKRLATLRFQESPRIAELERLRLRFGWNALWPEEQLLIKRAHQIKLQMQNNPITDVLRKAMK